MARILLTQSIHPRAQARLGELGGLVVAPDVRPQTLRACAAGCDVVVVRAPLPEDIFDCAPSLLGAVRHGAGVDMIPIEAATAHGVLVANVPGVNANAVAEHVLRSLLQLARGTAAVDAVLRSAEPGGWVRARALADRGFELRGRTLGLVGFGHVGQRIAALCGAGLGMPVLAHTRSPLPAQAPAEQVDLQELLARSDFVVLACPLTPATRGLIGAAELAAMRPEAYLVNVARGPVVDEAALVAALAAGSLAGAALDVFDTQPLPADHPLWRMAQVLITPHVAGISDDSMLGMGEAAAQAVEAILQGRLPASCINPRAETAFRRRVHARAPFAAAS